MTPFIYFFDLGNTRCKLWRVREGAVEAHEAIVHGGDPARILAELGDAFVLAPTRICGVSVLGAAVDLAFAEAARSKWGRAIEYATVEGDFAGLSNAYRSNPAQLGVDRWMGLIAADAADGECDALCVVGCGTAVTIDVLVGKEHKGGYILPGLELMQSALRQGTRQVRVRGGSAPTLHFGDNTDRAVRNGALAAIVALVERTVTGAGAGLALVTGGDAALVASFLRVPCRIEPDLLLRGMMRYFDVNGFPPSEGAPLGVGG